MDELNNVLQIVGFKNSGKTTITNLLIEETKRLGLTVSVIKHHGHQAKLKTPDPSVDSMQHLEHGADCSLVYGNGLLQIHDRLGEQDGLASMLDYVQKYPTDIILIEGYKEAPYPKVVLYRDEEDRQVLQDLQQIEHMQWSHAEQLGETMRMWYRTWLGENNETV
ncbi:molybdopterin-guanine dinucleotide biosynthesis protein B [Alkalibacillus salilacus]|uniref:Molybdopterin-guanine dinucleotide biosynthesis protein B n=1 Tax=Alkalibacillus salilacus TaxID=284582 RepID=A0ABT9VBH4_9BACI|nr:molybdopterin-guanine dinucleotide biosynthesis protein B [Alkalibacillus salilacus]MDQ0158279.1 molybdopterin-guanine dinucleotide biosynthesis protein B [Alkalibacillus salilacus]